MGQDSLGAPFTAFQFRRGGLTAKNYDPPQPLALPFTPLPLFCPVCLLLARQFHGGRGRRGGDALHYTIRILLLLLALRKVGVKKATAKLRRRSCQSINPKLLRKKACMSWQGFCTWFSEYTRRHLRRRKKNLRWWRVRCGAAVINISANIEKGEKEKGK